MSTKIATLALLGICFGVCSASANYSIDSIDFIANFDIDKTSTERLVPDPEWTDGKSQGPTIYQLATKARGKFIFIGPPLTRAIARGVAVVGSRNLVFGATPCLSFDESGLSEQVTLQTADDVSLKIEDQSYTIAFEYEPCKGSTSPRPTPGPPPRFVTTQRIFTTFGPPLLSTPGVAGKRADARQGSGNLTLLHVDEAVEWASASPPNPSIDDVARALVAKLERDTIDPPCYCGPDPGTFAKIWATLRPGGGGLCCELALGLVEVVAVLGIDFIRAFHSEAPEPGRLGAPYRAQCPAAVDEAGNPATDAEGNPQGYTVLRRAWVSSWNNFQAAAGTMGGTYYSLQGGYIGPYVRTGPMRSIRAQAFKNGFSWVWGDDEGNVCEYDVFGIDPAGEGLLPPADY